MVAVEMDGDAAAEAVASGSHAGTTGQPRRAVVRGGAVLERGMETYGADEYKSLWRYIKIADATSEERQGRGASDAVDEPTRG